MRTADMHQWLAERQQAQLHRSERCIEPLARGRLQVADQGYLNFSSNDYLALASCHKVRQAMADAALHCGVASTGSPLITGFHPAHRQLTETLCDWLGTEDALLLSSGFAANQAMLQTLVGEDERLLLDKLCHASMIDAAMQLPQGFRRFLHNDCNSLSRLLMAKHQSNNAKRSVARTRHLASTEPPEHQLQKASVVATEGVFSMEGDSPDLVAMTQLCKAHDAPLLLDDAHGLGVFGNQGRGSWQAQGLEVDDFQCLMGNFSKALAGQGGFLTGSATVIDFLRQQARHYIYSTALSPALCAAMSTAITVCRTEEWRREKLFANIGYFKQLAAIHDLNLLPSNCAIQPLLLQDSETALKLSTRLHEKGIWLSAIRPPTVPQARLRITLSAAHELEDIACLVQNIRHCWP